MKTIEISLYKFSELSEISKKEAIDNFVNDQSYFDFIFNYAYDTVKEFANIFNIDIQQIDFFEPYHNKIKLPEINITGFRLAKYIWNNYKNDIFKGQYYSLIKYDISGHRLKTRYSKILLSNDCVLTGFGYDMSILKPIYYFIEKPDEKIDFKRLINNCFLNLCKDIQNEYYASITESSISEYCEINDYYFTKNGEIFY